MKHKVFVYGTLRRGFENHYLLKNSRFIGVGKTVKKYKMTATVFPFVSEKEEVSHIVGEVYEVDDKTLKELDLLEDHPLWYKRKPVEVVLEDGKKITAWMYFNEVSKGRYTVPSGDFKDFKKKKAP